MAPFCCKIINLIEKNAHFNRERVPERAHAKGDGAFGSLEITAA